jgi:hypothetical protein
VGVKVRNTILSSLARVDRAVPPVNFHEAVFQRCLRPQSSSRRFFEMFAHVRHIALLQSLILEGSFLLGRAFEHADEFAEFHRVRVGEIEDFKQSAA